MPQTEERKKKFKNMTIEVKRSFDEEISRAAKSEEVSKSELVRRAVAAYIHR